MASLTVKGIVKRFGKVTALYGVDLHVEDAEFCVLLGPSGCGKSTLLNIVAGLIPQDQGSVLLDDRPVDRLYPRERDVAMQTIKSLAAGQWGEKQRTTRTWYEPLREQADVDRAVHWVLGHERVFLNSSSDVGLLEKILDAAERYEAPPPDAEMDAMVARAAMSPLFT